MGQTVAAVPSGLNLTPHKIKNLWLNGKGVPVLYYLGRMPCRHMGGIELSIILDLGIRWRWVVSLTPCPLYWGKELPVSIA
jgi:hypothetical protein